MEGHYEELGGGIRLWVTPAHKFGADAFLLADFASPRAGDRAADLGSGCGIVPALWFRGPEPAPREAVAVEIQEAACAQMARSLAEGNLPAGRFVPLCADLRELRGRLPAGGFDLVTCNPPYTGPGGGLLSADPAGRIARHETACTLADVSAAARYLLFYPQLGVKLCSMAGGGVSKKYEVFRSSPTWGRSSRDLLYFRQGLEIEMNFDRNVSCLVAVNGFMDNDFFDKAV